jgi:hypothetical protein
MVDDLRGTIVLVFAEDGAAGEHVPNLLLQPFPHWKSMCQRIDLY